MDVSLLADGFERKYRFRRHRTSCGLVLHWACFYFREVKLCRIACAQWSFKIQSRLEFFGPIWNINTNLVTKLSEGDIRTKASSAVLASACSPVHNVVITGYTLAIGLRKSTTMRGIGTMWSLSLCQCLLLYTKLLNSVELLVCPISWPEVQDKTPSQEPLYEPQELIWPYFTSFSWSWCFVSKNSCLHSYYNCSTSLSSQF